MSPLGFRPICAQFFCFAALQSVARTAGVKKIYAVRARQQICAETKTDIDRFGKVYDDFWRALGARDDGDFGYRIDLPVEAKLSHTPKESRRIWNQWMEIESLSGLATRRPAGCSLAPKDNLGHRESSTSCAGRMVKSRGVVYGVVV